MGFFDDLKLKKDGNGNLKITYNKKPFITVNVECVHTIVSDYATKKFLNRVCKVKPESDANDQEFIEANKLAKIYINKKKIYYCKDKLRHIKDTSKEFNYFIDAVKLINQLNADYGTFIDAQVKGLEFANTFPTPNQLASDGAEKRYLDYTSSMSKAIKIKPHDYELGSDTFKRLNRDYKSGYEMDAYEVEFLIEYNRRHHNQVPNSLTEYLRELNGN